MHLRIEQLAFQGTELSDCVYALEECKPQFKARTQQFQRMDLRRMDLETFRDFNPKLLNFLNGQP